MIVIADTSPINYLVRLGKISLLPSLYEQVLAPLGVLEELKHGGSPEIVSGWAANPPEWLQIHSVSLADDLRLGRGEAEAIQLATEKNAELLLIDDLPGRKAAMRRGLKVGGTLSILSAAHVVGLVRFEEEVERLRLLGFRYSVALAQAMAEDSASRWCLEL